MPTASPRTASLTRRRRLAAVAVSAADLTGRRQDLIAAEEAALTETVVEGVALTETVAVGVDLMMAAVDLMVVLTVAAEVVAADGEAVADLMVMDSAMAVSVVAAAEAVADLEVTFYLLIFLNLFSPLRV